MPPTFIDTNLLVYLYDQNQPGRQAQSHRVLEQLELTRSGRLSVQVLAEFFSVARANFLRASLQQRLWNR